MCWMKACCLIREDLSSLTVFSHLPFSLWTVGGGRAESFQSLEVGVEGIAPPANLIPAISTIFQLRNAGGLGVGASGGG